MAKPRLLNRLGSAVRAEDGSEGGIQQRLPSAPPSAPPDAPPISVPQEGGVDGQGLPTDPVRSSERPRERMPSAAPPRQDYPMPSGDGATFTPMNSESASALAIPARAAGGLYGSLGGLQGGGLGVPFDATPDENDTLSSLIRALLGQR